MSKENSGENIDFMAESSRNCTVTASTWRREGGLLVDHHNHALAVKNLPARSGDGVTSCPLIAELVLSASAVVRVEEEEDWRTCARRCAGDTTCQAWMWSIATRQCSHSEETWTHLDTLVTTYVAGDNNCKGEDLVLQTAERDPGSSAQQWRFHLNRNSLQGTDFYLERSQSLIPPTYKPAVQNPPNIFKWNFDPLGFTACD